MPNLCSGAAVIEVHGVTKKFAQVHALAGIDLHVAKGEVFGILGPNGAGKTTLINILATLTTPDSGSVHVAGFDTAKDPHAVRKSIALTGQFAAVDDLLTGAENLILFGRLRGLSKKAATERADELLAKFSLTDAGGKRVGTYSGGMRRRLDLAASLVVPVDVIILDEPTTGLDPRSRGELWDVVRDLRDQGLTIVLSTQYLEEADQLAERIVVIDSGRVIAEGSPWELKEKAGGNSVIAEPTTASQGGLLQEALSEIGPATLNEDSGAVTVAGVTSSSLAPIAFAAQRAGVMLADLSVRTPTLDDVFLQLTDSTDETTVATEGQPS